MYRVFEALDELVHTVEQAYGVPMTANCMVPRNQMLELLDDLRNALPVEIDDAQDVLDQQDEILRGAQERAATVSGSRIEIDPERLSDYTVRITGLDGLEYVYRDDGKVAAAQHEVSESQPLPLDEPLDASGGQKPEEH